MEVTEVKSAAELNQQPPKFVASTEGLQPPMDDNAVREIFAKAAAQGIDDLSTPVAAALQGQPQAPAQPVQSAPVEVPAKFQKPDGTVDEEKLKASSAQLDAKIEEKKVSIEEMLANYKARQKELGDLGNKQGQLQQKLQESPAPVQTQIPPNMEAVRQQLLALQQQDPIAFAVEIAKAVVSREIPEALAPIVPVVKSIEERQADERLRGNLASLAEQDPRILNPQLYAEVTKELESDPAYFRLKNPHKAAWNEVKERLRLGEPPQRVQAQPSTLSPTLGRGTPAPVSGLPQPMTQANLYQQAQTLKPYSEDATKFEDMLRDMTRLGPGGWQ